MPLLWQEHRAYAAKEATDALLPLRARRREEIQGISRAEEAGETGAARSSRRIDLLGLSFLGESYLYGFRCARRLSRTRLAEARRRSPASSSLGGPLVPPGLGLT